MLITVKVKNKGTGTTLMMLIMLIMSIVCLLNTLNKYIRLAECLSCSTMCFKFLKKIYMIWLISENIDYFLAGFR